MGACPPARARQPASLRFLRLCVADIRELQPSVLMSEEVYVRMCARELSSSLSHLGALYFSPLSLLSGSTVAPIVFSHECTLL